MHLTGLRCLSLATARLLRGARTATVWLVLALSGMAAQTPATGPTPEIQGTERRPLVLILHSYGPGPWVNSLQSGLLEGLNQASPTIDFYIDYMDTRRVESPEYLAQLQELFRIKYRRLHFDLVIACDDNAFDFALTQHHSLWPGVPVVFCGLDELQPALLASHPDFTGLAENNDLRPLLTAIPGLLPQTRSLLVVGDDSLYSQRLFAQLRQQLPSAAPKLQIESLEGLATEKIVARLENAPSDAVVLYLSLWRDNDGRVIPSSEAMRILQRSRVPVFSLRGSFVGQGVLGASYVDGETHGRATAAIALQVLHGVPPSSLPPRLGPPRQLAFDAPSLQRLGLRTAALPPGTLLLNQPFSFYEQYRLRVWLAVGTIAILATLVVVLVINIAQRRRAVTRLQESERKFHAVFDQTFQLAGLLDTEGRLVTINATALEFAGCTEDAVRGLPLWLTPWWAHDPQQQERVKNAVRRAAAGEIARFETHHRNAAGELRLIDFSIKPIRAPDGRVLFLLPEGRDVSDFRRTEENLHAVLDSAPLILWATDRAGIFTLSIGSGLSALGLKPNEVVGKNVYEFYRDFPEIIGGVRRALAGESVRSFNTIGPRTFEAHYAPQFGPNGEVIGSKGVAIDATERVEAQATRLQLATAVEQAAEEIVLTNAGGAIQYVNPAFERVTGYKREEVIGHTSRLLKSGQHSDAFYAELWATITAGKVWTGRFQNRRKDGTLFLEDATITPLLDDNRKVRGYVAVKRDVTHQVQLEETLRQTQRTEAIGKLAGGVAHDFNNILQVIKANVTFSRELIAGQPDLDDYLEQIDQAANRAAGLTRQLLAFGRKQALQFVVVDPRQVISDILKLIRRLIGAHIEIRYHAAPDLARIRADIGQIEQVVLNLCVNARDALPDGGLLELSLRNVEFAPDATPQDCPRPGRYVELMVRDNGVGMEPAVVARIFEPFFTTKSVGKGTGLGLPVVQGIVHQHEGFLRVESQPGLGTAFRLYLPTAPVAAAAAPAPAPAAPAPAGDGGGALILLAEDDPNVRSAATRILAQRGYELVVATDGEEACQLGTLHLGRLALAVFDVMMPRMSGIEAARRLRQLKPDLPVVLCSGYASGLPSGGLPDATLVPKPYTAQELLAAIQAALKPPAPPVTPA